MDMKTSVDLSTFDYVVSKINDGFLFERLAQDLTCQLVGIDFTPVGGVKDRGIDGLEHTLEQNGDGMTIYQFSIEADPRSKVLKTAKTLKKNGFSVQRLFYVTNRQVEGQDLLAEEVYKEHQISLIIRDIAWLRGNVSKNEATIRIYGEFVRNYAHIHAKVPQNLELTDYVNDPRVFVFLRQQFDVRNQDEQLRELLVDSLILFALEGTDPERDCFKSAEEILEAIAKAVKFPVSQIEVLLLQRLGQLSSEKPRKINIHRNPERYCLPFATRLKIDEQQALDTALHAEFKKSSRMRLANHLKIQQVRIRNADFFLEQILNRIFKRQGLDFSNFLLNQQNSEAVEGMLLDTINAVIETSGIKQPNKLAASAAFQGVIREIIYQGSNRELEYLRKLSNTYMLLFLLQCEPKVCSYFDSLAAKLVIFVCNSILVPAISEIGLAKENRRHWNLLVRARDAGVKIFANRVTLDELVGHIQKSVRQFDEYYKGQEDVYSDDRTLRCVDMIIIRAYLYERSRGNTGSFDDFIEKFVSPRVGSARMAQELISFLRDELGVEFIDDAALGVTLDITKLQILEKELTPYKGIVKAPSDARTILTVYALREKGNEGGNFGLFSYSTWWLSKDTMTHKAVLACFKNPEPESCYLRPDFLLNYIALSSRGAQASKVFDDMFPTLIGISLSHHVPQELSRAVQIVVKKHSETTPSRRKAIMSASVTELMVEGKAGRKTKGLVHYLDEKLKMEISVNGK
jgi:hypothetical protein